ncbi:DUF7511 domain-containing protein [Natronorubrum sulfidifaciens]|uniref:DUF7511 domain-containing protein n=1 Tax=Natronorubrum sulfidifaciens JCM 14089 TaxID=1230460 RepID=L9WIK0_9EURY|nr:hypothetical protein [Natronorubrum sulfidifaciens]ELY48173.1 hypothetical protein C495_01825 [Natronorubrum sulfidifaciens JCM 14089]
MSEQPDTMIEPTTEPDGTRHTPADRSPALQHVTVEYDADIAVCTMFPEHVAEDEIATQWLTATGDSFVSLADSR